MITLEQGTIVSFDIATYTATVRPSISGAVIYTAVDVSRTIVPGLLAVAADVLMAVTDDDIRKRTIIAVLTLTAFVGKRLFGLGLEYERHSRWDKPTSPNAYDVEFTDTASTWAPVAPWYSVRALGTLGLSQRRHWLDFYLSSAGTGCAIAGCFHATTFSNTIRLVAAYWPSISSAAHNGLEWRGYNRRCAPSGDFKINGTPSGTSVIYDNGAGGDPTGEANMYAGMDVFNLTRHTMATISTVTVATNTIVVTAVGDITGWADNDDLLVGNWCGWQIHSDGAGRMELRARSGRDGVVTSHATLAGDSAAYFLAMVQVSSQVRYQLGNADTPLSTVLYALADAQWASAVRIVTLTAWGTAATIEEPYVDYFRNG